jgi:hypothetical protein
MVIKKQNFGLISNPLKKMEKTKYFTKRVIHTKLNEFPCCASFSTMGKRFRTSNFLPIPVTFLVTFSTDPKVEYSA